jgi:4-methoxybenzoate monooxygenase (O-demethylating)
MTNPSVSAGERTVPTAPCSSVDPFDTVFLTNPYPFFEQLREAGPVVYLERYNVWALARHAECAATLADAESFCSGRGVGLSDFAKEPPWRPPSIILEADPPLHTRTHRALLKVLSPHVVNGLRESFADLAERLIEKVVGRRHVEAMQDIAREFPLQAFPNAVGILRDGRENLLPYGDMAFNAFGPQNERLKASMAELPLRSKWVTACCERQNLAAGGIGQALYALADAGEVTAEEAALLVRSLLTAGLDTTINTIGNALYCFSVFPEQWARLRQNPALIRGAIEEVCRFESPVQTFFRTTTRAVAVGGITIPEGEKVLVFLASANRDPRRWDHPEVFDVTRRSVGHLAFGYGIHRCVGEMLAKVETETLLNKLVERVASIAPAGPAEPRLNNTIRGFERLPLTLSQ